MNRDDLMCCLEAEILVRGELLRSKVTEAEELEIKAHALRDEAYILNSEIDTLRRALAVFRS